MRHGEVPIKDLQKQEIKFISVCPHCHDTSFEIILEVWKKNKTNPEKGREFVVNLKYLPPFTLFRELEMYIKKDQREERDSETEGLTKFDQVFKK